MRFTSKFIFIFIGLLMFSASLFGQVNSSQIWIDVNHEDVVVSGERRIIPNKFRLVKTNVETLKYLLSDAPMEFTPAAVTQAILFELPAPDGRIQHYRLFESPIMEAGLAAKYPDIKTYAGQCIENPEDHVRLDITPQGFHAMVMSPSGNYFIDPYTNETTSFYMSYFKSDFVSTKKSFECGVASLPHEDYNIPDKLIPEKKNKKENPESIGDCDFRTYRLALAATGEYTIFHGGTVAGALAAQVTSMNRVNGVYETDLALRMILIANNNLIIYTNPSTDPYTNGNGGAMLNENQTNLTNVIGSANYDIGHVFSTGGGGVAFLNSPCSSSNKAKGVTGSSSPVGDPFDIDYVAHEMGHQFGGNHTFNGTAGSCNGNGNSSTAFEVGSGTTIMAYAGICSFQDVQPHSDAYFHGGNFNEMKAFIQGSGNACAQHPGISNTAPTINTFTASQVIPKSTFFVLTAAGTDPNGNTITYCWEQMNPQASTQPPLSTSTVGPNFRSFSPTVSGSRYFPRLIDIVNNVNPVWEVLPSVGRTLNFRVLARDNAAGGGCNDSKDIVLTVDGTSGPFLVTYPDAAAISLLGNSSPVVTWNVNNTNNAPVSCATVDILLSTDGGFTYPITLATSVPNTGSGVVLLPNIATTTARIMVRGSGRAFFDISNNNFTITIGGCTAPTVNAPTVTQPTCLPNGSIVVNASGTGTLEYSINNGASWFLSPNFTGLTPSSYNIMVRLQSNPTCITSYSGNPVILNPPLSFSAPTVTQPTCISLGTIVLNTTGNGTREYSIDNGMTWQASNTFSNLSPGSYILKVRLQAEPACTLAYVLNPVILITPNQFPGAVATPSAQTICSGSSITTIVLTGNEPGTVFNWIRNNTATVTGIAASGTGNISGTLTNTTLAPITVTFTITPIANGCTGSSITATVIVNPIPTVNAIPNQSVCHGSLIPATVITGTVSGTVYNWTNNTPGIGLALNGVGNVPAFVAINNSNASIVATITVTPTFTNGGLTCTGTPKTYTITISQSPKAICKNTKLNLNNAGTASLLPGLVDGGSSGGSISVSPTSFNCSNIGNNTVTLTVTDACGFNSSCTAIVTVLDVTPPTILGVPQNVTIECGGEYPEQPSVVATDNCSATLSFKETNTQSPNSNLCSHNAYNIIKTWTAVDPSGNKTVKTWTISIKDTKPPVFLNVPPAFLTVECDDDNANNTKPIAYDECDKSPSMILDISYSFNENGCPHSYVATYTWTAGDKCGNKAKYVQKITVVDKTPPVIVCPKDIIVSSILPVPVSWQAPKASDNCDGQISVTQISGPPSGSIFKPNTKTLITYQTTDQCGNKSTCSFFVQIVNGGSKEILSTPNNESDNGLSVLNEDQIILYQNEPNPFNNTTVIRFLLSKSERVNLNVFNLDGKNVKSIRQVFEKGENRIELRNEDLPNSGMYYYQLCTDRFIGTKSLVFVK